MKILITGTTGFIGAHLLRYFSKNGHEVLAWSRSKIPPEGLSDFGAYSSVDLNKEVPKITVDACIHCAGYVNDKGNWSSFYANNVTTTKNVYKAVTSKLWINISSSSVYPISDKILDENSIDKNNFSSYYGKSKFLAEEFLEKECAPDQTIIRRDVLKKINQGYLNKKIEIKSASPTLVRSIIKITSFFGYPFPLSMQAFQYITTPTIIDINKIKNELGYKPNKDFYSVVSEITDWARSIPEDKLYGGAKDLAWLNYGQ